MSVPTSTETCLNPDDDETLTAGGGSDDEEDDGEVGRAEDGNMGLLPVLTRVVDDEEGAADERTLVLPILVLPG